MKHGGRAFLAVAALVLAGVPGPALAADAAAERPEYLDDCVVDEQGDCAQRCLTEHNCCIKSCNWVQKRAKSKCIKHCESILAKCYRECDKKGADDPSPGSIQERRTP